MDRGFSRSGVHCSGCGNRRICPLSNLLVSCILPRPHRTQHCPDWAREQARSLHYPEYPGKPNHLPDPTQFGLAGSTQCFLPQDNQDTQDTEKSLRRWMAPPLLYMPDYLRRQQ